MATSTTNQNKLELLRDILLPEEHKAIEELSLRVIQLEKEGQKQKELIQQFTRTLDEKLEEHKKELISSFDDALLTTLKKEIEKDPRKVAALLAPLTAHLLQEHKKEKKQARNRTITAPFRYAKRSWNAFASRFNSSSGTKKVEKQLDALVVEQLLVIDRKSLNLRACFEASQAMDQARIAVISGVVNDYIQRHDLGHDQHLVTLRHGHYLIYIQGFIKHFVALVVPGKKELSYPEKLQDLVFTFYYLFLADHPELLQASEKEVPQQKIIDRKYLKKAREKHLRNPSS